MSAIVSSDQTLGDLLKKMRKFPQSMINVRLAKRGGITGNTVIQKAVAEVEAKLGKKGRVLLRPSGTEPVVRVMVEGEDEVQVAELAVELSDRVRAEVGQSPADEVA